MFEKLKDWFYRQVNGWFTLMVIAAFASVISFFQINSYKADLHKLNGMWTVLGIVFGLAAVFCLYKVSKTSGGHSG